MAAKRCSICALNYPGNVVFAKCKVCDEPLSWHSNEEPTEDWVVEVDRLLSERSPMPATPEEVEMVEELFFALLGAFDGSAESPYVHTPAALALVEQDSDGRWWVRHEDLLALGYINIGPDTIIFVNGRFYEVQGGGGTYNQRNNPRWWIEEIDPEREFADLLVLSEEPEV